MRERAAAESRRHLPRGTLDRRGIHAPFQHEHRLQAFFGFAEVVVMERDLPTQDVLLGVGVGEMVAGALEEAREVGVIGPGLSSGFRGQDGIEDFRADGS
jgi:hypothetical protein